MADIDIRLAKPEEVGIVIDLVRPMWITHGKKEPALLNEEYLRAYDASSYFAPCFDKPETNALYIAVDVEDIVGCCRAEVVDLEGMFNERKAVYVDDLVIREDYQRTGLGDRLLNEIENFAQERGIKLLKTRIYEFNTTAQALCERRKFMPVYTESYKSLN